ncbi:MAG: 23S rRNA (adenine(2503)-C(2))-methyltransferase RlmN [Clostridiales bacterium]|nr:23S rRNA (adenine(2503)-C(2))-methyltransferase RlmN [Clostridiales bacterium]
MSEKHVLLGMELPELKALLTQLGQPAFRAGQVMAWLQKGVPFEEMSNLPKALRETLRETCIDLPMNIHQAFPSSKDDTVKFLFSCIDGNMIEGVLMHYHYGYSLCISTQVGCKMGCAFCASTLNGCVRSLTSAEMLSQVLLANRFLGERGHVGHIVLMGSGEPLDNYDHTVDFLRKVNAEDGLNISLRNISVSTCGLVPQMNRLAEEGLPITLSISLHAPNDRIRRQIMPIANTYPIDQLMTAVRAYVQKTGRRVVFEYALIDQLNSRPEHARELASLVGGMQCHVNLIPLNHVDERSLRPATPQAVQQFLKTLEERHVSATVRREMGSDIGGACGQLRRRVLSGEAEE